MSSRIKTEPEEEPQPSTSGGGVQPKRQPEVILEEQGEGEECFNSDVIDEEFLDQYCKEVEHIWPKTISKELFYTDSMVARNYARLSKEHQAHFDQMKELAESMKQETGDCSLIEDLMARVIGERFGVMKEDVGAVMGRPGEGAEGGKHLKQEGGHLKVKTEPGTEPERVVISAIVPTEERTLIPYCVKGDEEEDCETIGTDSDVEEINKEEVRNMLKELAELKRKEADCIDKLVTAIPEMRDSEVVVVAEKVRGPELPQCIYGMSERINHPRDFRATLAAGERLYSLYKFNQAGTPPISIPELCNYYDVGKTKIYELLHGGKYKYSTKEEETEKKPARRIIPEKLEEEPPAKKSKKTKAAPTT